MSATMTCTSCGKLLKTSKQIADGTLVKCPQCHDQFRYQAPIGGLPDVKSSSPAAPTPARAPAVPPPLPKPPPLPTPAAHAAADPRPKQTSGSWKGFLFFVALAFVAVGGGAWYFGRDYLPDLWPNLAHSAKNDDEDRHEPDDAKPDELAVEAVNADIVPDAADRVAIEDEARRGGAAQPEQPNSFASTGGPDLLQGPAPTRILDVAFAPDGTKLAAFDVAGTVILWDVQTGRGVDVSPGSPHGWSNSEGGRHAAFSSDGKTLVVGTSSKFAVIDVAAARVRWEKGDDWGHDPLLISPGAHTVAHVEKPDS